MASTAKPVTTTSAMTTRTSQEVNEDPAGSGSSAVMLEDRNR
jgi:hypothetical protein